MTAVGRVTGYIRLRKGRCVLVAAAAVLALGAGLAIGAVTNSSSSSVETASASTPTTVNPPASVATKAHRGVRGTITSVSGDTLTVQSQSGHTLTVVITDTTKYGASVTPSALVVGAKVVVVGPRTGTTVTALSVGFPRKGAGATTTPTTDPSSGAPA